MLKSLHKTAWTVGVGLFLTGVFAGIAYYAEARELEVLAANSVEDQFDKAAFALTAARSETFAAGAFVGTSTITIPMLKDVLRKIQFRQEERPAWIWARVGPASQIAAFESDIRRQDGYGSFTVHGQPAGANLSAPILFAAGKAKNTLLGLDLMSIPSFSAELGALAGSRLDSNDITEFLAEDSKGSLGESTFYVGALVQERVSGNLLPNRNLFVKSLTYVDFVQTLRISRDQVLELSKVLPLGGLQPIFYSGTPSDDSVFRTRELTVGSHILRLSISPPSGHIRPRNWVIVAIFGILSTCLISIARAWVEIGGRAKSLSTALSNTADELTGVRFKEAAFFENSGTGNCETDFATGRLFRVNEALCRLLGYAHEEITQMTYEELTHPGDFKKSQENLVDSSGQPCDHLQFEKRYRRKDGAPVWCLVNGRLVRDKSGKPAFYATVIIDISERKQSETTQTMLVAELAHRVRNIVQLTASLARQTANSARSVQEYDHLFHGRLAALKTAQDLLFDTGWKFALLAVLAERTLRPFIPPKDDKTFVIDLPNLELPTQYAQTLAIALNELAVNSAKYGALANDGSVHLKGDIETTGEGQRRLHLKWQEAGMTSVRKPRRRGFGMRMLEFAVPEQFRGFANLSWARSGFVYEAWLPLDYSSHA